jgi:hypothetical protein
MVAEDADFVAADWFAAHDVTLSKYYSGMAQMRNQLRWRYGEAARRSYISAHATRSSFSLRSSGPFGAISGRPSLTRNKRVVSHSFQRNNSGSLAMSAAMRRASSRVTA